MPDNAAICENFKHLRDSFKGLGDKVQDAVNALIAELEAVLVGRFLDRLRRELQGKNTPAEKQAAVQNAQAHLQKALDRLLNQGVPPDPWLADALEKYDRLLKLLAALVAVRTHQDNFKAAADVWCR